MQLFSTVDSAKDDLAAQLRFESFKMGKPLPASKSMSLKHSHARSHSRNTSISSLPLSHSKSTNSNDMSSSTTNSMSSISSKRNSHHRRRSSVSTRVESAEIMGVTLPDLPEDINPGEKDSIRRRALWALEGKPDASFSKVEIPELSTPDMEKRIFDFREFRSPTPRSRPEFEIPATKPSFPAGSGAYGGGLTSLMGSKRDSFKLLAASSSSKDQLHTLVEEEEEEEWDAEKSQDTPAAKSVTIPDPLTPVSPDDCEVRTTPAVRPRPVGLNLRPLSLTPETLVSTVHGLPTPSMTPSPRSTLRSLSLTPSSVSAEEALSNNTPTPAPRGRLALSIQTSTDAMAIDDENNKKNKPIRRSSISYKRSSPSYGNGLPTPEMTPTFTERRPLSSHTSISSVGTSSSEEDFFPNSTSHGSYHRQRPLSASEQHFLFKSHNALLSRIQDLERALSVRRESISSYGSRPMSTVSIADSEASSSEPSDEMLRLVADLKAERDELKRDVDGWRVRVGDLEKQIGVLGKRVEGERREAWVARSRISVLEAEKGVLEKETEELKSKERALVSDKAELESEIEELTNVVNGLQEGKGELEAENDALREEVERLRQQLRQDVDVLSTPTPKSFERQQVQATQVWKRGLSMDTEDSATDVETNFSFDGGHSFGFALKPVAEEPDDFDATPRISDDDYESEEDPLAGYEDEDDLDFQSPVSSSSFGSEAEFPVRPRSIAHLSEAPVIAPSTSAAVSAAPFVPEHRSRASLSKTWTFPRATQAALASQIGDSSSADVDRFFNCLEDGDSSSDSSSRPVSPSVYDYENSKGLFVNAMGQYNDDEGIPFALPLGVGVIEESTGLEVVIEEDEEDLIDDDEETRVDDDDDDNYEVFANGIKITFTPPMDDDVDVNIADVDETDELEEEEEETTSQWTVPISQEPAPIVEDSEEEEETPFFFGRPAPFAPASAVSTPPSQKDNSSIITPPSSIPKPSIPRSWSFPESPASPSSPGSSPTLNYSAFVTPPTKRGGSMPSFIPQPMSSPSPVRQAPTVRSKPALGSTTTTFIRQPILKPLITSSIATNNAPASRTVSGGSRNSSNANLSMTNTRSPRYTDEDDFSNNNDNQSSVTLQAASTSSTRVSSPSAPSSMMKASASSNAVMPRSPAHEYPVHEDASSPSSAPFSSFSSYVTSPKLLQKTFSNFMPRSWTAHDNVNNDDACDDDHLATSSSFVGQLYSQPQKSVKPTYVSKEKQMERLRARMQREGLKLSSFSDMCKKCGGDIVYS
ncbi:hypothetical protein D9758_007447 [Tetrapyrgos nigripes]|uniref:Uncharacterized protein n=1 Tax=Tetrapyrgos nigripes TaxID=182062 RepID=A0A8H5LHT4_9AGAR|nr:hypothetical protein D9758_007447 [Tetrapyrgos nigripes]